MNKMGTRWRVIGRIKAHIEAASSVAEVNAAAVYYRGAVMALEASARLHERTMAIQIRNLARYKRNCLTS